LNNTQTESAFMRKTFFGLTLLVAGIVATQAGCSKDDSNPSTGGTTTPVSCTGADTRFAAAVQPLIASKCSYGSGCHGSGASNSGGVLLTHAQISARASNIKIQVESGRMPQAGSLTTAEKASIVCWVNAGAPNN
jgi:hypothetical protein